MNKKFLSVVVTVFMFINTVGSTCFAAKKDVGDPVLQQIISELSSRMPRFINKYGAAVFVADENITRGTLLQALYEFDKKPSSSSAASVGVISKKDYDALNAKVIALEKKVKAGGVAATGTSKSGSVDFVEIMDDLQLNMPMLLDNTLADSKVFKALEKKVNAAGGTTVAAAGSVSTGSGSSAVSQATITSLQKNVAALTKKVDNVELSLASAKSSVSASSLKGSGKNSVADAQMLYDFKNFQKEIDAVNKKVSSMELKLAKSKTDSSIYNGPNQEDFNSLKKTIVQMNQSYVSLGKRLDNLEKEQQIMSASSGGSSSASSLSAKQMQLINARINSIRQSVDNIKAEGVSGYSNTKNTADIKNIEKRLSNLEKSEKSSYSGSSGKSSDSGSSKTSTVAKISLGLTMVAALFVAR